MARVDVRPARVHVAPPSVERQTPSPKPALLRSVASPEPTQITLGSDGRDGDGADGEDALPLEDGRERRPDVGRFTEAARRVPDVEGGRVLGVEGESRRARP